MLETRKDLNNKTQWKTGKIISLEKIIELNNLGISIIINDGEFCTLIYE